MGQAYQVEGKNISLHPNPLQWEGVEYKPKSGSAKVLAFLDTASGAGRSLQTVAKSVSLWGKLVTSQEAICREVEKVFSQWTVLGIPHIPGAFVSAKDALAALFSAGSAIPGAFFRRCVTALQESAAFVSTVGYSSLPFLNMAEKTSQMGKSVLRVAEVSTFVADTCDLVKNSEDSLRVGSLAKRAQKMEEVSPELKEALTATHKLHMIKVKKSICSVANFMLGLGLASTGFALLPGCILMTATISLIGTLFATQASLYEDGMKYKKIQLLNNKHVQLIPLSV
jgi:hypothetical protein